MKAILAFLVLGTLGSMALAEKNTDKLELPAIHIKNIHTVEKGKLYRSAQLDGDELERLIRHKGIKTIINLRGNGQGSKWYDEEVRVANNMNVKHVSIGMSARRLPHREDLIALLDAFKTAERPILIHCRAGADRTGEASAIYQMLYQGKTKEQALRMLSVKYFHVVAFKPAKKYFIDKLWQGQDWAYNSYDPCTANYKYYDKNNPQCHGGLDIPSEQEE